MKIYIYSGVDIFLKQQTSSSSKCRELAELHAAKKTFSPEMYAAGRTEGFPREQVTQLMIKAARTVTILSKRSKMKAMTTIEKIASVRITSMECGV